jgi:hypothetical protein
MGSIRWPFDALTVNRRHNREIGGQIRESRVRVLLPFRHPLDCRCYTTHQSRRRKHTARTSGTSFRMIDGVKDSISEESVLLLRALHSEFDPPAALRTVAPVVRRRSRKTSAAVRETECGAVVPSGNVRLEYMARTRTPFAPSLAEYLATISCFWSSVSSPE